MEWIRKVFVTINQLGTHLAVCNKFCGNEPAILMHIGTLANKYVQLADNGETTTRPPPRRLIF